MRLRELRPLLAEYEHLLAAAAALDAEGQEALDAEGQEGKGTPAAASTPPARRRGRPPGRPSSDRPATTWASRRASRPTPRRAGVAPKPAPKPAPEPGPKPGPKPGPEPAPKLASKRVERGVTGVAILAALEHGSHTASELVVVTAISAPIIQNSLRRLEQVGAIVRTRRAGDGKAAFALASTPV